MGSMVGLILQSLIFMTIGVWHLCSLFSSYVKSPRDYSARAWYPVSCGSWLPSRLKHSELYMMLLFIPLAIFYELGISTHFQPLLVDGGAIPGSSILGFEHVTTLFMFWLFALLVLLNETTIALPLPAESSFLFASLAFTLEWMSINHETVENAGLEKQCKSLLAFIVAICAFSSGMLAMRPKAFLVDMVLCMGLILQGTWRFQMALSLFVEGFIPLGCRSMQEDLTRRVSAGYGTRLSSTLCDIQEARIRAIDLMNLAFNCHIIVVVLFTMMALVIIAKVQGYRRINNSSGYDMTLTSDVDSESKQMKSLSNMTKLSFGRLH
ncbi:unnamed protein product [Sphagnum balticum]